MRVFIVSTRGESSGEMRAHVEADSHREALEMYMREFPGIQDMNTVYVADAEAAKIITKK